MKLTYTIHLKVFLLSVGYVMSLKYRYILSQVIARDVQIFHICCLNVEISLSLLCDYFVDGCLIYVGVNHSFYVPQQ
jgi:hypothetical protein